MKRSRFSEDQIIAILEEHEAGVPVSAGQEGLAVEIGSRAGSLIFDSTGFTNQTNNAVLGRDSDGGGALHGPTARICVIA
jgi:hypothetical protein